MLPEKRPGLAMLGLLGLLSVVVTLATLQYQWTGQITQAAEDRMRAALIASTRQFHEDFARQLNWLCATFQPDPASPPSKLEEAVLARYGDWMSSPAERGLLANVHIWRFAGPRSYWLTLDRSAFEFQRVLPPKRLNALLDYLEQLSWPLGWITEREVYRYPWLVHEDTLTLSQALFYVVPGERAAPQHLGFLILELDEGFFKHSFLPRLVSRHFGPPEQSSFLVAVRSAASPQNAIYQSDPRHPVVATTVDAEIDLLEPSTDRWDESVGGPLTPSSEEKRWRLAVQHRAGSVAAAVSSLRVKNLAISFSLLLLLAASMALILILARRSQRLAALQMEFVAGVSHELRTPLSIICSAADNLAEGIVKPERARDYGALIRAEGRRLARMVEQALRFAADQSGRIHYDLKPVSPASIIQAALDNSRPVLKQAGMEVELRVPPDLPEVPADANALSQCLENLITNAVKYASSGRRLAIEATVTGPDNRRELQITVEDHGPGIPHAEQSRIFEPFYRARAARQTGVRGAGLGLYLVRRMMEGMGGRVSLWSKPGRGARFTLHLPALSMEASPSHE